MAVLVILGAARVPPALAAEPVLMPVHGSPFATKDGYGSVAFSPSGNLLAATNGGGGISVFSVGAGGVLSQVTGSPFDAGGSYGQVQFSPADDLLAANDGDEGVAVFSVGTGGTLSEVAGSPFSDDIEGYDSFTFSPSGSLLAASNGDDGTVSVLSVASDGVLTPVAGSPFDFDDAYTSLAFSPSGNLLAGTGGGGGSDGVSVLSVGPGGVLSPVAGSPFHIEEQLVSNPAFSPSGGLLVAGDNDYDHDGISVFSVGAGGALSQVAGSPFATPNYGSLAFSPSGVLLAGGSDDGGVSMFSVGAGGALSLLAGSPFDDTLAGSLVTSIAFSPSGALLAVGEQSDGVSMFSVHGSGASSGSSPTSGGGGPVPVARSAPRISGHAAAGGTLSCASGRWSRTPSRVTYRWVAEGRPIPGAATKLIRVRTVEEGTRIACITTPYSGSTAGKPVTSKSVYVAVPVVSGCPAASRALSNLERLLGLRRSAVGARLVDSSDSGQLLEDDFCLTPAGVLVGYPPASLLSALPGGERARFAGRVVWISTANRYYSIAGVGAGSTLAAAKQLLKLQGPYHVGGETWYLAKHGRYLIVLIIQGGVVVQLGVSDWPGATTAAGSGRLLSGLREIARESTQISGPIRALDDYWFAIGEHAFLRATGYVRPGVLGSISGFVSSERKEGVHSAQFEGQLLSESGSRARVRIVNLITHDQQFGCRTWRGTYTLARSPLGRWQIARAAITPRSCT